MSLINEALKRAKQVQAPHSAVPLQEPALQPVFHPSPISRPLNWLAPAAGAGIFLLALVFLVVWWRGSPRAVALEQPQAAQHVGIAPNDTPVPNRAATAPPASVIAPPQVEKPVSVALNAAPAPAPELAKASSPAAPSDAALAAISTQNPPASETPQTSAPPESRPALQLQGIFYRLSKASVLINGQTLFLGDEIDGAKITGIERQLVRLLVDGKTIVLKRH